MKTEPKDLMSMLSRLRAGSLSREDRNRLADRVLVLATSEQADRAELEALRSLVKRLRESLGWALAFGDFTEVASDNALHASMLDEARKRLGEHDDG